MKHTLLRFLLFYKHLNCDFTIYFYANAIWRFIIPTKWDFSKESIANFMAHLSLVCSFLFFDLILFHGCFQTIIKVVIMSIDNKASPVENLTWRNYYQSECTRRRSQNLPFPPNSFFSFLFCNVQISRDIVSKFVCSTTR